MEPNVDAENLSNHNSNDGLLPEMGVMANVERIDKRSLKPITNPDCQHDWQEDDDEIGDMRAQTCRLCPLGRWVKK